MIETINGKYKKVKKGLCSCSVGVDYTNKAPRIIMCKKPAAYHWFWRNWFVEIIKNTSPIYSNTGVLCCEECFISVKNQGPPSDLAKYKEIWLKNQKINNALDE